MQHERGAQARGVIVYLAQSRHSSYGGRASITLLKRSVSLLFQNYNAEAMDDEDGGWRRTPRLEKDAFGFRALARAAMEFLCNRGGGGNDGW